MQEEVPKLETKRRDYNGNWSNQKSVKGLNR
jgi:hypothetical protein